VRDLLRFMEEPEQEVIVLDAPASSADLLPARVRRHMPRTTLRFRLMLWVAKLYVALRFGGRVEAPKVLSQHHQSWELTTEQTSALRARCRRENVSVQSAICTAFIDGFGTIHTPVSLRSFLARPVGESVGLFVGSADVGMRYRAARGFWSNARRLHRKLRRALRHPFRIFQLFSKAVTPAMFRELGPLLMRIVRVEHPLAITNLRELDASELRLNGASLSIESFFGAVTAIVQSSVLTVYTIGGRMHLHLLASESLGAEHAIRDEAERAVHTLVHAPEAAA